MHLVDPLGHAHLRVLEAGRTLFRAISAIPRGRVFAVVEVAQGAVAPRVAPGEAATEAVLGVVAEDEPPACQGVALAHGFTPRSPNRRAAANNRPSRANARAAVSGSTSSRTGSC